MNISINKQQGKTRKRFYLRKNSIVMEFIEGIVERIRKEKSRNKTTADRTIKVNNMYEST